MREITAHTTNLRERSIHQTKYAFMNIPIDRYHQHKKNICNSV